MLAVGTATKEKDYEDWTNKATPLGRSFLRLLTKTRLLKSVAVPLSALNHHYWRPSQLRELTTGGEPRLIFVDSMSDLFAKVVSEGQVRTILETMRQAPHHSYQSLTKAAPQILKYVDDLPPNLWVGVSSPPDWFIKQRISRQQQVAMLRKSLAVLKEVKKRTGNIVWMSAEPVSWDLTEVIADTHPFDWVVIGAATAK